MVGEVLLCQREPANSKDPLADVVMTGCKKFPQWLRWWRWAVGKTLLEQQELVIKVSAWLWYFHFLKCMIQEQLYLKNHTMNKNRLVRLRWRGPVR